MPENPFGILSKFVESFSLPMRALKSPQSTVSFEEAEAIADRVGVIDKGHLLVVDDKDALKHKLGKRQLCIELENTIESVPQELSSWNLELANDGNQIIYTYDTYSEDTGVADLMRAVDNSELILKDITTSQSSLEDIFINLVETQ